MQEGEPKKSFWQIYLCVLIFYAVMIVVYGIVVHHATDDGATADVKPDCKIDENKDLPYCQSQNVSDSKFMMLE